MRLPKEGGRLKGFGDVDFEDRDSLVSAMNMPDLVSLLYIVHFFFSLHMFKVLFIYKYYKVLLIIRQILFNVFQLKYG